MAGRIKMTAVARAMKARRARTVIMNIGVGARASSKTGTANRGSETYQCHKHQDRHHHRADGTSSVVTDKGATLIMEGAPRRDKETQNAREKDLELRRVMTR